MDQTGGNLSAYVADPELFRFAKEHAAQLRMTVSAYLNLLIELDRERDLARDEVMRRIAAPKRRPEAVPA